MNNKDKFYSRQTKLTGPEGQVRLNNASVLVIGAGGLGCPVLQYIAAMGVGTIGIIDNDNVDITNLHRQILYSPKDVGESKAEVAALKISEQNPYIKVSFYNEKLTKKNIIHLFENYEVIVDCTDNFETKFLVHDICYSQKKILVQASLYQYEGNLHVFDFKNIESLSEDPCLRCLWTKEPEDGCIGTCADVGIIGATAGVLGSLQATEVAKIILGNNYLKNGEGLFIDLTTQDHGKRKWKKNIDCPFCSTVREILPLNAQYQLTINEVDSEFVWIDLRSNEEVEECPIYSPGIIHMPSNDFNISKLNKSNKYLLVCHKGYKSNQLTRALRELGYDNLFSLTDGVKSLK
jgi:molybdopterin/thiamine biosynthesis adenylyltransferase/rhodanese-related sulfurtransferase